MDKNHGIAPGIGQYRSFWPEGGQKSRYCPRNRAISKFLARGWTKITVLPPESGNIEVFDQEVDKNRGIAPRSGQYRKNVHSCSFQLTAQHRRFLFFFHVDREAAANELKGSSHTGDKCCGIPNWDRKWMSTLDLSNNSSVPVEQGSGFKITSVVKYQ
ncbi:MAG: hypothetical protein QM296_05130 [Bacillota bacterium]|nr:hypothetical protein [Bacillota bacterium]